MKIKFFIIFIQIISIIPYSFPILNDFVQIQIPLDNNMGIAFSIDDSEIYYVDGFEIANNGNLYFFSGEPAVLCCFSSNEIKFRKEYSKIQSGKIYLHNGKLYSFNNRFNFDKKNIINVYQKLMKRMVILFPVVIISI